MICIKGLTGRAPADNMWGCRRRTKAKPLMVLNLCILNVPSNPYEFNFVHTFSHTNHTGNCINYTVIADTWYMDKTKDTKEEDHKPN